ncbi:MAG: lipase family protein [Sphingomonadales bacterium]|nr:MAG: lipase family protein [Sphingomonadales bacterium]
MVAARLPTRGLAMRYDPTREALYSPESQYPDFSGFADWTLDRLCAELSRKAYFPFDRYAEQKVRLEEELGTLGFGPPTLFYEKEWGRGTQAFGTVSSTHGAIVAFRGTQANDFWDGVSDIWAWRLGWDPRGKGKVHRGFWRQLHSILPQIEDWLATIGHPSLTFTGHSLGAALATLIAGLRPDARLITFGSPRVGDADFVDSLHGTAVTRYVDCADLVTRVPFWKPYDHIGKLIYIDRDGGLHEAAGEAFILGDREAASADYRERYRNIWSNVLTRNLADHAPINYVSAVLGIRTA